MNINELEIRKRMCDLFIDAYKVIIGSRQSDFDIIKSAEDDDLKKTAARCSDNYNEYTKVEKQIKSYYRQLAYKKFLEIADVHPYISRILSKIKLEALREENYKSFLACGLRLRPDYSLDTKMFYADYLVSTIKAPELEAMIEFEKQNRKWGK